MWMWCSVCGTSHKAIKLDDTAMGPVWMMGCPNASAEITYSKPFGLNALLGIYHVGPTVEFWEPGPATIAASTKPAKKHWYEEDD